MKEPGLGGEEEGTNKTISVNVRPVPDGGLIEIRPSPPWVEGSAEEVGLASGARREPALKSLAETQQRRLHTH